jgi:erythronate-4-phosphate dehydrogenase
LLDTERLRRLRSGAVLINASRGAVVDNTALLQLLNERSDIRVVLDVWESEPQIDLSLLDAVTLATPHIAGYSWDGKVAGTRAVLAAFCKFFRLPLPEQTPPDRRPALNVLPDKNIADLLRSAVQAIYDVRNDDRAMRAAIFNCEKDKIAATFDNLRKNYPQRREISAYSIENWAELNAKSQSWLRKLGFSPNAVN